MSRGTNPYNWQTHNPQLEIPRAAVGRVADTLREGGSAVVLGGRGMGKSVFLQQLRARLEPDPACRVLLISAPPAELTIRACLGNLARRLGVPSSQDDFSTAEIMERYFAHDDAPRRLVLLFDEFDRYAEKGQGSSTPPGRGFFNDLEATRRDIRGLSVMAAGNLGVFVVRDVLGSSFLSRALHVRLRPLDLDETHHLAEPFAVRDPLSDAVLDVVHLATGGIPALLTYGLQSLWSFEDEVTESDVTAVYSGFSRDHAAYLQDVLRSVTDPRLSEAPRRVLEQIRQAEEPLSRATLEKAIAGPAGPLSLELIDVLQLLEAAGLVHIAGSLFHDNPVRAHPIASLLNLPASSGQNGDDLVALLNRDLTTLLGKLHRGSVDFFRPGRGGASKQLVPESVFAAHLALGFELMGWRAEREAQSTAGRTDLKLRRNGAPGVLIIEVKHWGRNDYREAHRQVENYWTADVCGGAVVQLTDSDVADWARRYIRECLQPLGLSVEGGNVRTRELQHSPIRARLEVSSAAGGMGASIDHYLLRLPR